MLPFRSSSPLSLPLDGLSAYDTRGKRFQCFHLLLERGSSAGA
jgi:hypothetical protein